MIVTGISNTGPVLKRAPQYVGLLHKMKFDKAQHFCFAYTRTKLNLTGKLFFDLVLR